MKAHSAALLSCSLLILCSSSIEGQRWKGRHQPADLAPGDMFGWSVSVFEDTAMAAAQRHNLGGGSNVGAVYVFGRDDAGTLGDPTDDTWVQTGKLTASDAYPLDEFGSGLWIHGDTAVIGASGNGAGAAYLFQRDDAGTASPLDDTWVEIDEVRHASGSPSRFGRSVGLFDDTAVVGTREGNLAYVFERRDASTPDPFDDYWEQTARLTASDFSGGRSFSFGWSVSIYGDTIAVSARRDDEVVGNSGSVYMYQRDDRGTPNDPFDDLWPEIAKMWPDDPSPDAQMGRQIVLWRSTVIAGAFRAPDGKGVLTGGAYVFERDDAGTPGNPFDDDWFQLAKLSPPDGATDDRFGGYVGLYGEQALVGSPRHDSAANVGGAVYSFLRDDGGTPLELHDDTWSQTGKFVAEDPASLDSLGGGVAISEDSVFAGAPYYYNGGDVVPGKVFAFDLVPPCRPTSYGIGLPGSGGFEPELYTTGCAFPGGLVAVHVDHGMGGSYAGLAIGLAPASIPFAGGELLVAPILEIRFLPMNGVAGQPGGGASSFPALLPPDPSLVGLHLFLQGACLDPGAPVGISLTRGLELVVQT